MEMETDLSITQEVKPKACGEQLGVKDEKISQK